MTVKQLLYSEPLHKAIALILVVLFIGTIGYLGLTTLPVVLFIIYAVAFFVGLAFIPLFAYTFGPSTGIIAESIANLMWIVSNLGVRRPLLVQRETDEYEINRGSSDLTPTSYWSRWALAPFGITFEATKEAFEDTLITDDLKNDLQAWDDDNDLLTDRIDLDRGGYDWYVDKTDKQTAENGGILVYVGQKLSELQSAAGPSLGLRAYSSGLEDYGGDTSGHSNRAKLVGAIVFIPLGLGMGWLVFF